MEFIKYSPKKVKGTGQYGGLVKIMISKDSGSQLNSGIFILKQGQSLVRDVHESDEVFYVIKGRLTVSDEDGNGTEVLKGEMLYIPAGHIHYSSNKDSSDAEIFWCNIETGKS
jgi:quercetin dioxygenase-like cupin family protein